MVKKIIVVGGGSAGFMAALALKTKIPNLDVRVIRSKAIGVIGVGEGSTMALTRFLHEYLNVNTKKFFEQAQPIWKLGLRFNWGPRKSFMYSFGPGLTVRPPRLRKPLGYYCGGVDDPVDLADALTAMMTRDRVFMRRPDGLPELHSQFSYHLENDRFVTFLENFASAVGVQIVDETITHVQRGTVGVERLDFEGGGSDSADLYVDCSGFASLLLHKTLGVPFVGFEKSLFCDRAVVGGWSRESPNETIFPYTTCDTMSSGWCWQIDHESRINRGYVYSSAFTGDEDAEREFRDANPRVDGTRLVKFTSGYYARSWQDNVVAVGNASGFVEPLEATALGVIAAQCRVLVGALLDTDRVVGPAAARNFSDVSRRLWETTRAFIAIHYRFNTRLDTSFWRTCRETTDLGLAAPFVECYQENGPSGFWSHIHFDPMDQFGVIGYATLLVGQCVPYRAKHQFSADETKAFADRCRRTDEAARRAMTVREALAETRSSRWDWSKNKVLAASSGWM